jgi:glycine/D-amino acid oxidase-like deaminating enzyme
MKKIHEVLPLSVARCLIPTFLLLSRNLQPTTHNPKTLIVGAGLAGCALAWRLQQTGEPLRIIGSSTMPGAAKVAAGIINPVTGRWMTKSWRFDDFAPEAADFYAEIGRAFSAKLHHPLPAVRFCLNADDAKRAKRRCRNPRYANVLSGFEEADSGSSTLKNTNGCFRIEGAAYVDLPRFIEILRLHFQRTGLYEDEAFDHERLTKVGDAWHYAGQCYTRIVFCEGAALARNPWFQHLPLTPAKGETLLCRSETLELGDQLHHHGKWLLPYPDGSFRIGATYDETDRSPEATSTAREALAQAFRVMTEDAHPLRILEQPAGLRPSTRDARPFLGAHPTEPRLYVFNGLGSKGASLAPTLSRELRDFIFNEKPLDPETDIARFDTAYPPASKL